MIDPIRAGEVLRLPDFLERTQQKHGAWRTARRKAQQLGITLDFRSGRQCYVLTDSWIEYLKRGNELKGAAQ